VLYNPQLNGVAERKNKTFCEATRAMIRIFHWAEAASTVVYIQDICLYIALEEITPEEVFTGKEAFS
jgi:hypothetical protein